MSLPKAISRGKDRDLAEVLYDSSEIDFATSHEVVSLGPLIVEEKSAPSRPMDPRPMLPSRVAIVGNYLPRKCGIASTWHVQCLQKHFGTFTLEPTIQDGEPVYRVSCSRQSRFLRRRRDGANGWCRGPESNWLRPPFQGGALPVSYPGTVT